MSSWPQTFWPQLTSGPRPRLYRHRDMVYNCCPTLNAGWVLWILTPVCACSSREYNQASRSTVLAACTTTAGGSYTRLQSLSPWNFLLSLASLSTHQPLSEAVSPFTFMHIRFANMGTHPVPIFLSPTLRTCACAPYPSWIIVQWIIVMAFDLVVCSLTFSDAIRYYRSRNARLRLGMSSDARKAGSTGGLLFILLRDSVTFPLV